MRRRRARSVMPRTFHVADAVTVALREKQLLSQHHFETFEGGKKCRGGRPWRRQEMVIPRGTVKSEEMRISLTHMSVRLHSGLSLFSFSSRVASHVLCIQMHGILDWSQCVTCFCSTHWLPKQ